MDLTPTQDARIFETQWFTDPNHPLIETKVFYSKADDFLFYITAHRGPTTDDLVSTDEVKSVILADSKGHIDDSLDKYNALIKFLDTPTH